jgi:methionyl-tRNA formyltransferase
MIVTQEDAYYIPQLIARLMPERRGDIVGVTVLRGEMEKRDVRKYLALLGLLDFARYVVRYGIYRVLDLIFRSGLRDHFFSVAGVARRYDVPLLKSDDVNSPEYLERLRALEVDLLISVAAPEIFRAELLSYPSHGCINIHNSLLPRYQGMLPSFWALANGERVTGTTVHFMNEQIDGGDILLQEEVPIEEGDTLHSLVYRTKVTVGPSLLLRAIRLIEEGEARPQRSNSSQASYYSFPDRQAAVRFRRLGRKFL